LSASGQCGVTQVNARDAWWQSGHVLDTWSDGTTSVSRTLQMDTACLADGTYSATFSSHCGRTSGSDCIGQDEPLQPRTFTVVNTPTVSATAGPGSGPTLYDVTIAYDFPNTRASDSSQRYLYLMHIDPLGNESEIWHNVQALPAQSGSISFTIDTSCWLQGGHQLKPGALHACARSSKEGAPATVAIQRTPVLSVKAKKNTNGSPHLSIDYQFFDSAARTIVLELLATPTVAGGELARFESLPMQGTIETDVPTDPRPLMRVTALNGNCYWTDKTVALSTNSCCPGGGPPGWVGNPVRLWNGAVAYSERDPLPDDLGLVFQRTYRSDSRTARAFGVGWRSAFDGGVAVADASKHKSVAVYTDGDDRVLFDQLSNGAWLQTWPSSGVSRGTLTGSESSGYAYREAGTSIVRLYGGAGNHHLLGIQDLRTGRRVTITYNTSGDPTTVADSFGNWSCAVTTDANHRITQIAVNGRPDMTWNYTYDGDRNLMTVTLAGVPSAWRTYGYVQAGSSWYLASVADAMGHLLEQHAYDASGRAITSLGSAGDITAIQYNNTYPSTTVVTRADNSSSTYTQTFADREVTSHVAGGCAACGGHDLTAAYDDVGHLWRVQDGRGYITESLYATTEPRNLISETRALRPSDCDPTTDLSHCALSDSALAAATLVATAASSQITYVYADANWPDRPTQISRDSVMLPGQFIVETLTYDALTGQTLTRTTTGATGTTPQTESHTTTTTLYNGTEAAAFAPGGAFDASWLALPQPAGVMKSIRGPRTDVDDTTLYVYYPIAGAVPAEWRGRLAAVKNALGHVIRYEGYDVFGRAAALTDPNGVVTSLTFDALGRMLTSTIEGVAGCDTSADPLCATNLVTSTHYANTTGPADLTVQPNGGAVSFAYDARGRITAYGRGPCNNCTPSSFVAAEQIVTTYDAATQKKASESFQAFENGAWAEKRHESYSYDAFGRLARTTHADNTAVVYSYDNTDNLAGVQDERHTSANTLYAYDPAGRLAKVTQTLGAGSVVTSYGYDTAGDLTSVTDPNGNVTAYLYDDFGRMLRQTSPVTGVTSDSYDAGGNLTSVTDANGATTTRTYDAAGRVLTAVSSCTGYDTEQVAWTYDDPSPGKFGIGRVATMTDPSGSTSYAYERRGFLRNEDRMIGTWSSATSYAYDAGGNRTQVGALSYTYDTAGRPTAVTRHECDGCQAVPIVAAASYLPFGPETSLIFANGTQQSKSYDARYRMMENKLTGPSGLAIADYTYAFDAGDNVMSIHDVTDASFDRSFDYDDLSRLTTANTGIALWGTGSYAYDSMGNVLSAGVGDWGATFTYVGSSSRLATATQQSTSNSVAYDAAGNELNGFYESSLDLTPTPTAPGTAGRREYSCRNLLRLVVAPSAPPPTRGLPCPPNCSAPPPPLQYAYTYDGRGVRVHVGGGSSIDYVYTPELQLRLMHETAGETTEIAWFNSCAVAQTSTQSLSTRFTFADHLGTPLLQTDAAGEVVWRAEYEPYGRLYQLRAGDSEEEQPLRLPGQEIAAHSAVGSDEHYNVFRWYRAGWGRYTQPDPVGLDGNLNLFAYAAGDPIDAIDPSGLTPLPPSLPAPPGCSAGSWYLARPSTIVDRGTYYLWTLISEIKPTQGIGTSIPSQFATFVFGYMPNPTTNIVGFSGGSCDCIYAPAGLWRFFDEVAEWNRKLRCGNCLATAQRSVQSAMTINANQRSRLASIHPPYRYKFTSAPYNSGTNECLCPGTSRD
jgi:RHS repeat-associated protein